MVLVNYYVFVAKTLLGNLLFSYEFCRLIDHIFEVRAVILNQTFLIFKIASAANIQEESCPDILNLRLKYIEVFLFISLCLKVGDEVTYQVYKSYDILGLF